jgi:hypothetical protein
VHIISTTHGVFLLSKKEDDLSENVIAFTTQIIALLMEISNKLNTQKSMSNITNTNVVEYFWTECYLEVKFLYLYLSCSAKNFHAEYIILQYSINNIYYC